MIIKPKTSFEFICKYFSLSESKFSERYKFKNVNPVLLNKSSLDIELSLDNFPKVRVSLPFVSHEKYISFPSPSFDDLLGSTNSNLKDNVSSHALTNLSDSLSLDELNLTKALPKAIIVCGLVNPIYIYKLVEWSAQNNIKQIAFVDTNQDNLYHSCYVVDWEYIFDTLKLNNIQSSFFFDPSLGNSLTNAVNWFTTLRFYSGTNFYYYIDRVFNQHCQDVINLLKDPLAFVSITSMGFYEDNLNMVVNSFNSFSHPSVKHYRQRDSKVYDSILLIGSGPSLEDYIDEISYMLQYSPIVICCGSSITSLLEHGIIPNYVVLVERNVSVYLKHRDNPKYHDDFKKIDLIAASTVDHRIFSFYKNTFLYTRSSNIFSASLPDKSILTHTHTTSANAGLSFALSLNPSNIFLYGLNFGSRDKTNSRDKNAHGVGSYNLNLAVSSNLGTMFSNRALMRSKLMFDRQLREIKSDSNIYLRGYSPTPNLSSFISRDSVDHILQSSSKSQITSNQLDYYDNKLSIDLLCFDLIQTSIRDFVPSSTSCCYVTDLHNHLAKNFCSTPEYRIISPFIKSLAIVLSCACDVVQETNTMSYDSIAHSALVNYQDSLINTIIMTKDLLASYSVK